MKSFLNGILSTIPIDRNDVAQEELNIANKLRSNPLPWKGQFSPQLIEVLLNKYGQDAMRVLDPFVGSGTALLEAAMLGKEATGIELNPAAVILARIYEFCNIEHNYRKEVINAISDKLNSSKTLVQSFLSNEQEESIPSDIKKELLKIHSQMNDNLLQRQLLETLIILLDFYKDGLNAAKVQSEWIKLKKLVLSLPYSSRKIMATQADARSIPISDHKVDFVITSPPYINVFNYHQQYRASVEALDHSILKVAQSEIGSNRKNRGNRCLTVIQYCLDMALVLSELSRVCRKGARLIFVVGRESSVRKTPFFNAEIVAEIAAQAANHDLVLRQERVFTNRFGQAIYEDILHLVVNESAVCQSTLLQSAREIALKTLMAGKRLAPEDSKSDFVSAINSIGHIEPSPYFQEKLCQKEYLK